jgi:CRISPR-associated protein Csy3
MSGNMVIPSVLAVRRAVIISDGLFYGVNTADEAKLIPVIRHGIRGTQNQTGGAVVNAVLPQTTESAKTFHDSKALRVEFSFRPLPLMESLTSCSGRDAKHFRAAFESFVTRAEESAGLREVCYRMARNVFNGRWLWRNRQLGVGITVRVNASDKQWEQDALKTPMNLFGAWTEQESALGDVFMGLLSGGDETGNIRVEADINLGMTGSVEVYPSQNYTDGKPKGFARPLYKVDVRKVRRYSGDSSNAGSFEDTQVTGLAALRDQKIWNALRTLDTWYADYAETRLPIPVEPLGANLSADTIYRNLKNGSLFDLLPRLGVLDPNSDEGMFAIACLMRGGVFGVEDKEKKAAKTAKTVAEGEAA